MPTASRHAFLRGDLFKPSSFERSGLVWQGLAREWASSMARRAKEIAARKPQAASPDCFGHYRRLKPKACC